jgi:hypothetical protein
MNHHRSNQQKLNHALLLALFRLFKQQAHFRVDFRSAAYSPHCVVCGTVRSEVSQPYSCCASRFSQQAAVFVALTVPISGWDVAMHLRHYENPQLQRCIIRILLMVPIYAIDGWFGLFLCLFLRLTYVPFHFMNSFKRGFVVNFEYFYFCVCVTMGALIQGSASRMLPSTSTLFASATRLVTNHRTFLVQISRCFCISTLPEWLAGPPLFFFRLVCRFPAKVSHELA